DAVLLRTATTLAVFANELPGAAELVGRVAAPDREPAWRVRGRVLAAQIEMARGRWRATQEHLAGFERFPEQRQFLSGSEYRAVLAVLPFLPLPPGELEAIRDEVSRLPRIPSIEYDARGWDWSHGIYAAHQHYLRGLLSARLGDPVAALGEAMQLEAFVGSARDTAMSRRLARGVRAEVARIGGQPHDALRLLPEPGVWPDDNLPRAENYGKERERFLYAELLRTVGRDEEALRWYATFPDATGADLIYLAPSHLRRAEIHERRGEREKATEHYRRFIELWQDADPELQPLVSRARQRLERG
ncbi:MAG TPA: hypothetical protein VGR27_00265, partial [Longimicrobiaceae bacterium]|nr:hypothetical protein [Longimicrobiaceae bacterium]